MPSTILDIELTINRFGLRRIEPNKYQVGPFRIAWWKGKKVAVSFEVNWWIKPKPQREWWD